MSRQAEATVRLYGFVPMTRRRYIFQLVLAGGLALSLLVAWVLRWPTLRHRLIHPPTPTTYQIVLLVDAAPWLIGAGVVLQAIEAWIVLRLLAKKEKVVRPNRPGGG